MVMGITDAEGCLIFAQQRGAQFLRAHPGIKRVGSPLSLGGGILVDAVALDRRPHARLTMPYRATGCLRRSGANP